MKTNYLCRNCFYYPTLCENGGKQRRGGSYICKYFKLKDERPKGEWIYDKGIYNWRCSECGQTPPPTGYVGKAEFMATHFKFCNYCGADMKGE